MNTRMSRSVLAELLVFLWLLGFGNSVAAASIFESAPATGRNVADGGYLIDDSSWAGARFDLSGTYKITSVSIELAGLMDNGSFFAALVSMPSFNLLDGATHVPVFTTGAASLEANSISSAMRLVPLADYSSAYGAVDFDIPDVVVGSGSYGVIIGSGAFGALGYGSAAATLDPTGKEAFFSAVDRSFLGLGVQWAGFDESPDLYGARIAVQGMAMAPIPEPETYLLMTMGLLAIAARRRQAGQ